MSTRVELVDLWKRYPGSKDVSVVGVDLTVAAGSLVALLGPSGCGKTTTLKMIVGLLEPTRGDVLFNGVSMVGVAPEQRRVPMVFQKPLLFPHMTVGENVGFGLRMRKERSSVIRAKVRDMLALVHLDGFEERRANELSGGQEQRVSLARALVTEPDVLLLDEPLSQLDANLRIEMRDLIQQVQRRLEVTTIFVTHDQDEAVMLADRVALMFGGKVEQEGEPRTFYEKPRSLRVARFFGTLNLIPGRVGSGEEFVSALGVFRLPKPQPPGPATLTVRQEQIKVGPGENQFVVRVDRTMYLGTVLRVWATANGQEVQFIANSRERFQPGDLLELHVQTEDLWVILEESTGALRSDMGVQV